MRTKLLFVQFLLVLLSTLSFAVPKLEFTYTTDAFRIDEADLTDLVIKALQSELDVDQFNEGFCTIYSKQERQEEYIVVNLLRPNQYGITTYRLDLHENAIIRATPDYIEEEPLDPNVCGTCPDPELELVFAYITDYPSSTQPAVDKVIAALKNAKVKYAVLKDAEESKQSILNYLACPKLVMWGRIGHGGSNGAIQFGYKGKSGSLSTKDITTSPFKEVLKGRYFPFNCCYVGGNKNTFGKGLISSGGIWMCAGNDVTIGAGSSEPVWANFMIDVCTKNTEVIATFNKYMKNAKDKWAYQSQGSGPFYPFKEATALTPFQPIPQSPADFTISVASSRVNFSHLPGSITIFSPSGKIIRQLGSSMGQTSWSLADGAHHRVPAGTYIAVLTTEKQMGIQRMFSIVE